MRHSGSKPLNKRIKGTFLATKRIELIQQAERIARLYVQTHSPGDGVTRYRFFDRFVNDYSAGRCLHTALGLKEANIFLEGYIACLRTKGFN